MLLRGFIPFSKFFLYYKNKFSKFFFLKNRKKFHHVPPDKDPKVFFIFLFCFNMGIKQHKTYDSDWRRSVLHFFFFTNKITLNYHVALNSSFMQSSMLLYNHNSFVVCVSSNNNTKKMERMKSLSGIYK